MAFSYQTKLEIHDRAGGRCECVRRDCYHIGRCLTLYKPIINPLYDLSPQAERYIFPGFEFHHKISQIANGADTVANGAFLCVTCHQRTNSFGTNLTRG